MSLQAFRTRVLKDNEDGSFRMSCLAPIAKRSGVGRVKASTEQKAHELCALEFLKKMGWTGVWVGGAYSGNELVWVCSDDIGTPTACHKAISAKMFMGGMP